MSSLPDLQSTQSITKFLRTSSDLEKIFELIKILLKDDHCVLPKKELFISQLLEQKLNNDTNSISTKANRKKQVSFYKEWQTWEVLSTILDRSSQDCSFEVIQSLKSIKYLELLDLCMGCAESRVTTSFLEFIDLLLQKNYLVTSKTNNVLGMYLRGFNKFISQISPIPYPQFKIFENLFNYLVNNGSVNVKFADRNVLSVKSHPIKEFVKFYKDNSQFLVEHYIANDLLNNLASLVANSELSDFVTRLINMFWENSISFEITNMDQFQLSTLVNHFNLFIEKLYSDENIKTIYTLLLRNLTEALIYHNFSVNTAIVSDTNGKIINTIISNDKLAVSIHQLVEINILETPKTKSVSLNSEFLESLYKAEIGKVLELEKVDFSVISEKTDEGLSAIVDSIDRKKLKTVNFQLLSKLMVMETDYAMSLKDCIEKYGTLVIILHFQGSQLLESSIFLPWFKFYTSNSYSFIQMLELFRKMAVVCKFQMGDFKLFQGQLFSRVRILSLTQLDKVLHSTFEAAINKSTSDYSRDSYFVLLWILLRYLSGPAYEKFINNQNHNAILLGFLKELVSSFKFLSNSEWYYKVVFQLLTIFSGDELENLSQDLEPKFINKALKVKNVSSVMVALRYIECFPNSVAVGKFNLSEVIEKIIKDAKKNDKTEIILIIFQRFFNVLALVENQEAIEKLVDIFIEKYIEDEISFWNVLDNQLLFEVPSVNHGLIKSISTRISKAKSVLNQNLLKAIQRIPIECYNRIEKVDLLDILSNLIFEDSLDFDTTNAGKLAICHLLSSPTHRSKIETDVKFLEKLFASGSEVANAEIVKHVVENHLKQYNDTASVIYLNSLVSWTDKCLKSTEAGKWVFVQNVILNDITNYYSFEEKFKALQQEYVLFCIGYLKECSLSWKSENSTKKASSKKSVKKGTIVDSEILEVVCRGLFNLEVPNDTALSISNIDLSILKDYNLQKLKTGLFSILPKVSKAMDFKFVAYYINLYLIISQDNIDDGDADAGKILGDLNDDVASLSVLKVLNDIEEVDFVMLYTYALQLLNNTNNNKVAIMGLLAIFLKSLKSRSSEFDKLDKTKLLSDTLTSFMEMLDNSCKFDENILSSMAIIMNYSMGDANFLLSQYSFELSLTILFKIIQMMLQSSSVLVYQKITKILGRILLLYRFRLRGRYHIIVSIYNSLLGYLAKDSMGGSLQDKIECAHLYSRALGNLVQPNDQAAKSITRGGGSNNNSSSNKELLTSNVNLIKKDMRPHLANMILQFVKYSLSLGFSNQVRDLVVNQGIFLILDTISASELSFVNANLDVSGRSYFKTVYEDYNKFGKWKE
ncbi:Urb2 protein [Saccharomycopsis crataegensis]|uniref:Urb2 protein n=1 Tax=Saccharomycopsis crataegensis TaxID=43959 RepID=A0AAV5QSZ8_9ASCO|nr:Urb2 protein [Saccharomycopsis crataegensis]